jgi:hypothetical protein
MNSHGTNVGQELKLGSHSRSSDFEGACKNRNTISKWFAGMKEYRSSQGMSKSKTHTHQEVKFGSRSRIYNAKDPRNPGNKSWKWFQRMKECKYPEGNHT